jgi:hypothetical protein
VAPGKIDDLYRLPLEEFTKARNALAKTLSGDEKRVVASLPKPTAPIWAVNQLYWNDRATYDALIDAAEKLRAAHRAVLGGKKADLRKPDDVHRAALDRAAAKATGLLEHAAGRVSEQARDTIRRALGALPNDEQAGRLTREPEPAGFSLFAGVTPRRPNAKPPALPLKAERAPDPREAEREQQRAERAREKAERERKSAIGEARKHMKAAQQAAERATFAARKAESELARAKKAEEQAAGELKDAERRLAELERPI